MDTLTNITLPLNNNAEMTVSASITTVSDNIDKKAALRAKRIANLKPFKKGHAPGRPKGVVSIKESLKKALTPAAADAIIKDLINDATYGTASGSLAAKKFVTELTGEYNEKGTAVVVNNNSLTIDNETMEIARQLIKEREAAKNLPVIDIK